LISSLAGKGIWLGVVSNKQGDHLRQEAHHLGWDRYFGRIVGATDAPRDKPAPDPVNLALEGSGLAPGSDVWFVGDTSIDMECARNSGCVPVLVRETAPEEGEFAPGQGVYHYRDCQTLESLVRALAVPISVKRPAG
jgi:phosphoglycolate phosphatase